MAPPLLSSPRMLRLAPLVLCLAASTAAADGFYVTEGLGGTRVKGELAESMPDAFRVRLSLGFRAHDWGLEGYIADDLSLRGEGESTTGYAVRSITPPTRPPNSPGSELTTYGVDLKRYVSLTPHLELYAGAGLSRGSTFATGYAGNGLGVRAGAQLKGRVPVIGFLFWPLFFTDVGPKVTGALFIDQGVDFYRLHDAYGASVDAQLSHVTVGFGVGSDF